MKEHEIQKWLKEFPGARRAANGFIIGDERGEFYVTGIEPRDPDLSNEELVYAPFCSKNEILRLRSLRSAHDYLLRIRANSVADSPRVTRVLARRKRAFQQNGRPWTLTSYYETVNLAPRRYLERLPKGLRKSARSIPHGYVPTLEVNAACLKSLVGEVIIVSEALRYFLYFMTVCFHGAHYEFPMGDRIDSALIALRTMIGSEAQDFDIDPRAKLPASVDAAIKRDVDDMLEFTFGHEFSHLLLGHMEEAASTADLGDLKAYNHDLEFSADLHAITAIGSDKDARLRLSNGAYHIFLFLHLIELLGSRFLDIPRFSVSETHPAPLERLYALKAALGDRNQPTKQHLDALVKHVGVVAEALTQRIDGAPRSDLLSFYGSIYLFGLGGEMREDRIDF
ncbi:hypothetical protein [Rhizobium rhizogenes]|uniref:hypothetical protein n=1 Tax=Rhizobium rhizogenes TaxID=359 RepID=UPI0015743C64|nr:hypothetical protein [Rhizobium rhizogenes]NTF53109.1 hypothetical protein [Rhizobium rhizogenes]